MLRCAWCNGGQVKPRDEDHKSQTSNIGEFVQDIYLIGSVELNTMRRYLFHQVMKSEVSELLPGQICLCATCMEFITRIYDFENEIDRIRSLIDSIVRHLKGKAWKVFAPERSKVNSDRDHKDTSQLRILACTSWGKASEDIVDLGSWPNNPHQEELHLLKTIRSTWNQISTIQDSLKFEEMSESPEIPDVTNSTDSDAENSEVEPPPETSGFRRSTRLRRKPGQTYLKDFQVDAEDTPNVERGDDIVTTERAPGSKGSDSDSDWVADQVKDGDNESDFEDPMTVLDVSVTIKDSDDYEMMSGQNLPEGRSPGKKSPSGSSPVRKKKRGRKCKTDGIPAYKIRKTGRKNRTVTKLGPDQYEFFGYRYNKIEDGHYRCESCSSILKTRDSALSHVKRVHLGEGTGEFLCSICGQRFDRLFNYRMHTYIHSETPKFQCERCGKSFKQQANLWAHRKIHEGQYNFVCEVEGCGRKFFRIRQLNVHMLRHTGERPFECEICHKCFGTKNDIYLHSKTHSGERPFECEICHKFFARLYHAQRHMKTVHRKEDDGVIQTPPLPENPPLEEAGGDPAVEMELQVAENVVVVSSISY